MKINMHTHVSDVILFVMKEADTLLPMEPKAWSTQNNQAYPSEKKIHFSKEKFPNRDKCLT